MRGGIKLEDSKIIDLYWARKEQALAETDAKYGSYCRTIARNILRNFEDTEECVSDTWLHAWNSMPPQRPGILHTHCTTGMAYMTVTKAIESGIDVIDCATSCFSNGTSQPATETMFYALQQYGIQTGLNEDVINKVNDFFKPVKQKYVDSGRINPKSMATDAQALVYKVPGGMLSNMIANLTDMKAMDKFDAALAEIPAVRKDLGYPPLVTPLSQMVGNQAVTNVLLGERYKQVSKEVKNYFKGEYGIAPAPVSEELQTKILGEGGKPVDCRIEDSKRTGEEFKAAKEALGDLARSEEDVMSYICYPDQAMKFFEARKAKEENICKYSIVEA